MRNLKTYKKVLIVLFASIFAVFGAAYLRVVFSIPGELVLIEGEEYIYNLNSLFPINIKADREGILDLNGRKAEAAGRSVNFSEPVSLKTIKDGSVMLDMRFFGLLPVKTVRVDIVPSKQVAACGNTVGVKLKIDGILVVGVSDVETANGQKTVPARDTGIKPGYIITGVNDRRMEDIDDLIQEIESSEGKPVKVAYKYGSLNGVAFISPAKAAEDKRYHIGLWVRDSTAGIGTLTYYDPATRSFGALGHGITDIDTGTLMPVESGEILESNILGVKMGKSGTPGELKGIFVEDTKLGTIDKNSEVGIYGKLDKSAISRIAGSLYPIGVRADVKVGPASILSNIDGKNIEEFSIDIQKVSRQNLNGSKGMIIKITDRELLDSTGGIVQGMSGSPIIQGGKIVGAVTHVLVNDPTRGYGIFIEAMLKNIAGNS
jgi:stage IV sporulation protein B